MAEIFIKMVGVMTKLTKKNLRVTGQSGFLQPAPGIVVVGGSVVVVVVVAGTAVVGATVVVVVVASEMYGSPNVD